MASNMTFTVLPLQELCMWLHRYGMGCEYLERRSGMGFNPPALPDEYGQRMWHHGFRDHEEQAVELSALVKLVTRDQQVVVHAGERVLTHDAVLTRRAEDERERIREGGSE